MYGHCRSTKLEAAMILGPDFVRTRSWQFHTTFHENYIYNHITFTVTKL